jgi:sec-independent protein translocase protein TatA
MFGIGTQELIIILIIAFIIFGAKALPDLGKGLGQAIHSFKKALEEPPKEDPKEKVEDKK